MKENVEPMQEADLTVVAVVEFTDTIAQEIR
jgi:hypothetical protein